MSYIEKDKLKQFFFILVIMLLGLLLFWKLYIFFPGFLGALTLYILMRPLLFFLTKKRKWNKPLTAILLILLSVILVLLPIGWLVNIFYAKVDYLISHSAEIIENIKTYIETAEQKTGYDFTNSHILPKVQEAITGFLPQLLGATFNTASVVAMMYFILYFMFTQAEQMEAILYKYLPLKSRNKEKVSQEIKSMVISNAIGIPGIGIAQAVVAALGYWIFGIDQVFLWATVTGLTSVIPVVGTAITWVPLCIYLLIQGATWKAIGLAIYCLLIIGTTDNVFRFAFQKAFADVHPLITILGVIAGLSLFGFIGLVFGPLLISMFLLLLKVYRDEFSLNDNDITVVE